MSVANQFHEMTTFNIEGLGPYELPREPVVVVQQGHYMGGTNKLHFRIPLPVEGRAADGDIDVTFVLVPTGKEKREFQFKGKDLLICQQSEGVFIDMSSMEEQWIQTVACPAGSHYRTALHTGNLTLEQARYMVMEYSGQIPLQHFKGSSAGDVRLELARAQAGLQFMFREYAQAEPESFLTSKIEWIQNLDSDPRGIWMSVACVLSLAPAIETGLKRRLDSNRNIDHVNVLVSKDDEFDGIDFETWLPLVLQMVGRPDLKVNLYVLDESSHSPNWCYKLYPAAARGEKGSDLYEILGIADGRAPHASVSYAVNGSRIVRTPHALHMLNEQLFNNSVQAPKDCIDAAVIFLAEEREAIEEFDFGLIWELDNMKSMLRDFTPAVFTVYADAALELHKLQGVGKPMAS